MIYWTIRKFTVIETNQLCSFACERGKYAFGVFTIPDFRGKIGLFVILDV
jgi:hypothetical protein